MLKGGKRANYIDEQRTLSIHKVFLIKISGAPHRNIYSKMRQNQV